MRKEISAKTEYNELSVLFKALIKTFIGLH